MNRGKGQMTIDLQGPFEISTKLINESGHPFVVVDLWPDVGIYITSEQDADAIIQSAGSG